MTVLVTVLGSRGVVDLEMDDARPIAELLDGLAAALDEPSSVSGLRTPDGRDLGLGGTLADARVLDGHRLILVPSAGANSGATSKSTSDPPVLPCYLALDTSDSMVGPALEALNIEVARLVDAVRADSRVADLCRLAVVTFDAEARLHLPLTPVPELGRPPRLAATRAATNFEAAFRLLRRQIAQDLDDVRSAGQQMLRPAVFLLTDGRPTRGHWPPAHAELTDASWPDAPDIVVFGFGDAAACTVRRIATAGAYLPASAPGTAAGGPAAMVATVMTFLLDALRSRLPRGHTGTEHPDEARACHADAARVGAAPGGWRSLDDVRG